MTPAAILAVMNYAPDRDARTVRVVRLAEASPDRSAPAAAPVSPAAARARRYRARKRGEDVPKRKPGPEPRSVTALSREVDALRRENARLAAEVAESRKLTPMLGMRRQRFTLGMASQLRAALEASDPAKDAPALREALRDLGAAIEARHDHWPE
jgi:predicted RNase H-like nuclease (RuvC/YqgF family)